MSLIVPTYRQRFITAVRAQLGLPVMWGMKGPDALDCSGSVTSPLKLIGGPDLTHVENAQGLYGLTRQLGLVPTDTPIAGDLVFYGLTGPGDIAHVVTLIEDDAIISADGATSHIDPAQLGFARAMAITMANPAHRVRQHASRFYRTDTKYIVAHRNTLVDQLDQVER